MLYFYQKPCVDVFSKIHKKAKEGNITCADGYKVCCDFISNVSPVYLCEGLINNELEESALCVLTFNDVIFVQKSLAGLYFVTIYYNVCTSENYAYERSWRVSLWPICVSVIVLMVSSCTLL